MLSYDRIQKILDFQMINLDEMLLRVIIYINRREEREANGGDIQDYFKKKMLKTY